LALSGHFWTAGRISAFVDKADISDACSNGMRPKLDFPGSSARLDRAGHDQFSAALPYYAISTAKTF
jgi:hypothetical protein